MTIPKVLNLRDRSEPLKQDLGQVALNGARLALAQLALDADTLIKGWEARERMLDDAAYSDPSMPLEARVASLSARSEIARCKRELQSLLRMWEPK